MSRESGYHACMATVLQPRPPASGHQTREHPVAAASHNAEPANIPRAQYHPLVIVLAAFATGIVIDRYRPLAFSAWCILAAAALGLSFVLNKRRKEFAASIMLLVAVAALAAAWHHDRWNLFGADDVGLFARSRQEPVCIEAVALQTPQVTPQADSNPLRLSRLDEEVRLNVELKAIRDGDQWRTVTGCGDWWPQRPVPHLAAGDAWPSCVCPSPAAGPRAESQRDRSRRSRSRPANNGPSPRDISRSNYDRTR